MIRLRHAKAAIGLATWMLAAGTARAHDAERTQVSLAFDADGAFVLDVSNDANWLRLRLEDFAADYPSLPPAPAGAISDAQRDERLRVFAPTFVDRVVIWIDHAEARAASAEYIPPHPPGKEGDPPIGTVRLRGRVPANAHVLRWFYGIVIDPYPLSIRYPDGRRATEAVLGNAWSTEIDVSGAFHARTWAESARARARAAWLFALRGAAWKILLAVAAAVSAAILMGGIYARVSR